MKKLNFTRVWWIDLLAMLTFVACFTPLVIPMGRSAPQLLGVPYTMWMGVAVSIAFVLLAYFASKLQKKDPHDH